MTFRTYWTSSILNHETVTGSKFFAEYIYNAFALRMTFCAFKEFFFFATIVSMEWTVHSLKIE